MPSRFQDKTRGKVLKAKDVSFSFIRNVNKLTLRMLLPFSRFWIKSENYTNVLEGIDLSITKGNFVGVLGKNGAGKSTLLRVLSGIYSPDRGGVWLSGKVAALFEMGGGASPELTGEEYAARYLSFLGKRKDDSEKYLKEIYEFSELGDFFFKPIRTYSSGMVARLYFSVVTAVPCEIYLIDEILSVGDEYFQNRCWSRIRNKLNDGAAGVLVTHAWTDILKLCKYGMVIEKGRSVFSGGSMQAVQHYLGLENESNTNYAKFTFSEIPSFRVKSLRDVVLEVPIQMLKRCRVEFSLSVEFMDVGRGWEIIQIDKMDLGELSSGEYRLSYSFGETELNPGNYLINIFLNKLEEKSKVALDSLSWTGGEAIELVVEGVESDCLFPFDGEVAFLG